MPNKIEKVEERLGILTKAGDPFIENGRISCMFLCDCGKTSKRNVSNLRYRAKRSVVSCGCLRGKLYRKHGMTGTPEYMAWSSLRDRCKNPNNLRYRDYGGRGILVSPEWDHSFERFFEDMGPRPVGTSIDRIDNNGNYCRANCRWATKEQQLSNKRKKYTKHTENNGN